VDFEDSPELAAFRAEVREFLDAHAELRHGDDRDWSRNGAALDPEVAADYRRRCVEWQGLLYESGWAGLTWPTAFGGRGLTAAHQIVFNQELARYDATSGFLTAAMALVGPTLMAHGSPEQQERYIAPLLSGQEAWCQLFSEPGAGSDLAALATRAVRDGDEWVVNGQKVWTSSAQHADFGILITRTDPDVPKHDGLTYFIVDMTSPGVDVRPLVQAQGVAHFNEVFLDDVRIPDTNRVGDVDGGFAVILTTLGNERSIALRRPGAGRGFGPFDRLIGLVRTFGDPTDPTTRQRLAQVYVLDRIKEIQNERWRAASEPGRTPGPVTMIGKMHNTVVNRQLVALLTEVLGARLVADTGEWGTFAWTEYLTSTPGMRIGGGTEEIVRNTVAERVLGLPKEPRV